MNIPIRHILLIDDDQDDQYFFATALEEVNPDVQLSTAHEGGEAFEKLAVTRPDIILLDLVMPGMSGLSFLKAIKEHPGLSNIPVLVYTSDLSVYNAGDLVTLGAEKVMIKAPDYGGTVEIISRLLDLSPLRQSA